MSIKSFLKNLFLPKLSNIFLYGYYLRFIYIFYEEYGSDNVLSLKNISINEYAKSTIAARNILNQKSPYDFQGFK